jgi:hypothetical protein
MLSILMFVIAASVIVRLFPKTELGRWLSFYLVELPCEKLAKFERKHMIFLVFGIFMVQGFAMVVSVDLAVIAALDLSLYIDAALSVATVAAVTRISSAWNVVASKYLGAIANLVKRKPRAVKSKTAVSKSALKPSNDDDPTWDFEFAASA